MAIIFLTYHQENIHTVLVAYPDGTNKKVSNYVVEQVSAYGLDFKY
jgi:hypothetical protein